MTSPTWPVFDGDGGTNTPKRPTTDDMGGLLFENSIAYPPTDGRRPRAENWKEVEWAIEAIAHMMPIAKVDVTWSGTAVTAVTVISASNEAALQSAITTSTISAGGGGFIITWPAGTLPPRTLHSRGFILEGSASNPALISVTDTAATTVTVSITDTQSPPEGLADACKFSVDIYGEG